jgi:hypothetical protein
MPVVTFSSGSFWIGFVVGVIVTLLLTKLLG